MNSGDFRESSHTYGLHLPARCISALLGERESTMFLIGTVSVRGSDNEVHLFRVPDKGEPKTECIFPHPYEIWDLAPCPTESDILITTYRDPSVKSQLTYHASLWRMTHHASSLSLLSKLDFSDCIRRVQWSPIHSQTAAVLSDDSLAIIDVEVGSLSAPKVKNVMGKGDMRKSSALCWEPWGSASSVLVNSYNSIQCWDTRSSTMAWQIEHAHSLQIRDIDCNVNVLFSFCSAGDDSSIKFWDYRKPSEPIKNILELSSHSHWVWSAKHNPSYDQLLVSASSDTVVNLWDLTDISSVAGNNVNISKKSDEDWLVKSYCDGDGDSIYSVAWACADNPFIFASLSHDKTSSAVVYRVPQEQVDQILLRSPDILV